MVRVATPDQLNDGFLCCQVRLSYVVKAAFGMDPQRLKFGVIIQKNSAAFLDAVYGGFYKLLLHGSCIVLQKLGDDKDFPSH